MLAHVFLVTLGALLFTTGAVLMAQATGGLFWALPRTKAARSRQGQRSLPPTRTPVLSEQPLPTSGVATAGRLLGKYGAKHGDSPRVGDP